MLIKSGCLMYLLSYINNNGHMSNGIQVHNQTLEL